MRWRPPLVALACALTLSPPGWAAEGAGPSPEQVGTWRFKQADRPIKAIVLGGSVTAWPRGNFGQFLEAACPRVEVVNRGKARLGAPRLHERFKKQVLRNRRIDLTAHAPVWLLFQGGLNSIGSPERTNRWVSRIFRDAQRAGMKRVGITLGPWGSERDKRRWRGAAGLAYQAKTRLAVDFVMGRLTPAEAFGDSHARDRVSVGWDAEELPDVAVDLYDSALRDQAAPLRESASLSRRVAADRWVRARLRGLPEVERATALTAWVAKARALPRWYLREDLQAFDHIHPNMEGHRLIAQGVCEQVGAAWGCRCDAIGAMSWDVHTGGLTPRVP